MAGVSDYFSIGSTVACKTCYDKEIEGEVLAFDQQTKMLILKCQASNGKQSLNDVHVVNLSLVSDVQVKKEVSPSNNEPPQSLNLTSLNNRVKKSIDEKRRLVRALQKGVSPEAQNLFKAITKTIDDVKWNGPNIVVLDSVSISPPYKPENVHFIQGKEKEEKANSHVKKLVEKFLRDSANTESSEHTEQQSNQSSQSQQTQKKTGPQ